MDQKIGKDIIIFTLTCITANKVCLLLRKLGDNAVTINGQMSQAKRLGSLSRFRQRDVNILVATDVASRGLDIPSVDLVINYDLPMCPKDYIHRVGRTAKNLVFSSISRSNYFLSSFSCFCLLILLIDYFFSFNSGSKSPFE